MPNSKPLNLVRLSSLTISVLGVIFAGVGSTALSYHFASQRGVPDVLGKQTGKNAPYLKSTNVAIPAGKNGKKSNHEIGPDSIVTKLEEISTEVKSKEGNSQVAEEINKVAQDLLSENEIKKAEDAIEQIEKRPGWQKILFGAGYKNLGQLRSTTVRNRNIIRKLNQAKEQVKNEGTAQQLQEHISTLQQEQTRLETVLNENEDAFSLFGWVSKLFAGTDLEDEALDISEDTTTE
jgi:hypothetical protein